ncbi:MAG TPA: YciI family protein [Terriglobales bacterium]|nr:YciI family protein [Terriglobales bacterium]
MKFICLGYYDPEKFDSMTEPERNSMMDECFAYDDTLRNRSHWAGGEALQPHTSAKTVRWTNGKVAVTDGPYAETREQIGGILVLEARDLAEAVDLMSKHPAVRYNSTFEIRPVGDMSEMLRASEKRRAQRSTVSR